jgi:hypothetical protein
MWNNKESHAQILGFLQGTIKGVIGNLEKVAKQQFSWDIDRDGRGHSEWISQTYTTLETAIDGIIDGYKFKVVKVPKKFLPLTVDKLEEFLIDNQLV